MYNILEILLTIVIIIIWLIIFMFISDAFGQEFALVYVIITSVLLREGSIKYDKKRN